MKDYLNSTRLGKMQQKRPGGMPGIAEDSPRLASEPETQK